MPTAYVVRGAAFGQKKDYDKAIADYSKALQITPDYIPALNYRSWVHASKANFDHELADAAAEVRLQPNSAGPCLRARGHTKTRRTTTLAIADASEALRLEPKWSGVFELRGRAYEEKGEYDRAIADESQAIQLLPNDAAAYNGRAWILSKKGDYERAIEDATEAIRLRPGFADALDTRADAYMRKGDFEHAIIDETAAIQIKSDDAILFTTRADIYRRKGEFDRAIADANERAADRSEACEGLCDPGLVIRRERRPASRLGGHQPVLGVGNRCGGNHQDEAGARPTPHRPFRCVAGGSGVVCLHRAPRRAHHRGTSLFGAPLANPRFDAELIRASLELAGFAVVEKNDLDLDGFEQALTDFAETAKGADIALFYFAGHGFSIAAGGRQQNLLMSTSANFAAKTMLTLQGGGEPLEHVEETIIGHARATLIFIDACRNVPTLASRGVGSRGFAPIDSSNFEGAYVVLSTRQGKTAEDGLSGQGSPFARAFARSCRRPVCASRTPTTASARRCAAKPSGEQVPDVIRSDLPEGGVVLMEPAKP